MGRVRFWVLYWLLPSRFDFSLQTGIAAASCLAAGWAALLSDCFGVSALSKSTIQSLLDKVF